MRTRFAALVAAATSATLALARPFPREGMAQAPAASLPPVHLQVTGDPTPVETLRLAIVTAARAAMPEAGTGRVSLTETAPPLQPLPEASAVFPISSGASAAIAEESRGSGSPSRIGKSSRVGDSPRTIRGPRASA